MLQEHTQAPREKRKHPFPRTTGMSTAYIGALNLWQERQKNRLLQQLVTSPSLDCPTFRTFFLLLPKRAAQKPPPVVSGPGLHTTAQEPQTYTIEGSGASNTTKIPREDTQRDTKRAKRWRDREKKREILGLPTLRGPTFFWVWGRHPSGPHPLGLHPSGLPLSGLH